MNYTCIHISGHLLSDDILHAIEQDSNYSGNRDIDFGLDSSLRDTFDYVWSSLRNDWKFYLQRSGANDPYGTKRSRDLMERFFNLFGYQLTRQSSGISINGKSHEITYLCENLNFLPIIVIGDKTGTSEIDTLDKCSLDYRAKGTLQKKSPHATMLDYLNSTECVYGIISNGHILRLIRNSGQLVKVTYLEFDLRRMLDEDKYTEFCLMFRLLHASRFITHGEELCFMERYFNASIESGNRIRDGLSGAVQKAMETIGNAVLQTTGAGNDALRSAVRNSNLPIADFNHELMHFIYRLLFLFIIEERDIVYQIPEPDAPDYDKICRLHEIYAKYYAVSRLRHRSECSYVYSKQHFDMWLGLMETFRLFEDGSFGKNLGIAPLGGVLFSPDTLRYLKHCSVSNSDLMNAFRSLNEFPDERGQLVRINYNALDVEEFGSVYEGILEKRPHITEGYTNDSGWSFEYSGGLDRQSTSSYYTRPDLVQNLIRTTLEPVIRQRIKACRTDAEKIDALLNLKVCDPACGSGHFILAMARTIAWYICTIRTGEDNPASLDFRKTLHEVIQRCVYAVDLNPDAVELCKLVLWIEGYCTGKPMSFLDHRIRCGNSVAGVTDLTSILEGVPSNAFSADSPDTVRWIKAANEQFIADRENGSVTLFSGDINCKKITERQIGLAKRVNEVVNMPEDSLAEKQRKQSAWESLMTSPLVKSVRLACDTYTAAFFHKFTQADYDAPDNGDTDSSQIQNVPYTGTVYLALNQINHGATFPASLAEEVTALAKRHSFFHWCVEFPEVFADPDHRGFDVICGNPPWDLVQMEDEKWFAGKDDAIVRAPNQATRKRLILSLQTTFPELYEEYLQASYGITCLCNFIKNSKRFPLSAHGKIDLYPLFAEHSMACTKDAWGLVLPTGIALNDTNKEFFGTLVRENRLISIYDFENRERLFDIDSRFKFCLLTAGKPQAEPREVHAGFYLTRMDHLLDPKRIYALRTSYLLLLNPNTGTCPVFRTSKDADLTVKIYRKAGGILIDEHTQSNPWNIRFKSMFNMSTASDSFRTYQQLKSAGARLEGNTFTLNHEEYVPLYEGKMIWLYNHHHGTWPVTGDRPNSINPPEDWEMSDPDFSIMPWYWVKREDVRARLVERCRTGFGEHDIVWQWKHKDFFGFRGITNATNERTFIVTRIPNTFGVGNSITLMFPECNRMPSLCLQGMLTSLVFDYVVRQKIGGSNASICFVEQFPVLPPDRFDAGTQWEIAKRVIPLCYFNHDMDEWATELWNELTPAQRAEFPELKVHRPFRFDPDGRAVLQAELDAIFAKLYGLDSDDLRYILDPEDICGPGCINETFRVLKSTELEQFGEYRTKRLVLDAWDRLCR